MTFPFPHAWVLSGVTEEQILCQPLVLVVFSPFCLLC